MRLSAKVLTLVAAASLLPLAGCGGSGSDDGSGPIVIGSVLSLTGDVAPLGVDMKRGTELAIQDYGKVKGRTVKAIFRDSKADPNTGLQAAQELVQSDNASVLMGLPSSAVTLALAAQANRLNVPIVSTNSQAVEVTGSKCNKDVFRTNPNDAMGAKANAAMLNSNLELKSAKWFVVYHDYVWGKSNKEAFESIPGVKVVGEAGRPLGTADWSSVIQQIQQANPTGIYLALAVGNDIPNFIKQARSFGLEQPMLPPLGMPDSMLNSLGEGGVGLQTGGLFGTWMSESDNPKMKKFVEDFYKKYNEVPGPQAIQAYSGAILTLTAMDKAKSLDTDDIEKSLVSVKIDSVLGETSIRPGDHQGRVGLVQAEAVKLPEPKYGSTYAWKPQKVIPWSTVQIPLSETGCKGLA